MAKKIIIAAGGLVLNEKNELLLIFRRGKWDLPKGKLDAGESIESCAVREVQEETGIQHITLLNLLGKTYHEYFDKWIQEDVIKESWWYVMQASSSETLIPQTEEDIEQIIWADKNQIKECMTNSYENVNDIIEKLRSRES
jgi:mutator protein MutT